VVDVRWATDLPRDAMPNFYRDLDVLVVTSRSEGGPLPLMEALCCGVPVVTTHVGLADLHVQHGHNGWFFGGRNPEGDEDPDAELYRRLRWLARNPAAVHDAKVAAEADKPLLRWPETSRYWALLFDSV